jgi:hypothetical protein
MMKVHSGGALWVRQYSCEAFSDSDSIGLLDNWGSPDQATLQKLLTSRIRGVDLEEVLYNNSVQSLPPLCDALEPRDSNQRELFPPLRK